MWIRTHVVREAGVTVRANYVALLIESWTRTG
jgi:hypothetical protein